MPPALTLIIPANNESEHIGSCLSAVLASDPLKSDAPVHIIVAANGCSDDTAQLARGFAAQTESRGWQLDVIELAHGNKIGALNAAEAQAKANALVYLDADVRISPSLLAQTASALQTQAPIYTSGSVKLSPSKSWATRAYGAFYLQTPFMKQPAPGCGYFGMNTAGRARWAEWPAVISDDTLARLSFAPSERIQVEASYEWPLVDGLRNLIKVRRRQNAGVSELAELHPELEANDTKVRFTPMAVIRAVLRHPIGTIIYGTVSLIVKLTPAQSADWKRGR